MADDDVLIVLDRLAGAAVGLTAASLVVGEHSDLTLVQWRGLVVVAEADGPLHVREIAERLRMSLPSASRLVRRLERHGLVAVARDEDDRRSTLVRPTAAGSALRAAVLRHRRAAMRQLLDPRLPLPDRLADGLRAIADAFDGLA